jgi:beta-lactamase regulating signal transducer with metallopeptidase domain
MLTLLHSLWQSALLLLGYIGYQTFATYSTPLFKRNLLFGLLGWQLVLSVVTFVLVYFQPSIVFVEGYGAILGSSYLQEWMQQNSSWLVGAYAMVVVFKTAKTLFQRHQLYHFYSQDVQKASISLRLFTKEKALHFGIHKNVEIWLSNRVHTPLTFGFWKPMILLPVALVNQLSTTEAEAIILHELTHIKAKDYLLNWLLLGVATIYFFNPFIHLLIQKIRLEREKNCDLQVLQFAYSPILYAESLLKTAQFKQEQLNLSLAAFQNRSQLLQRIQFFTNPQITTAQQIKQHKGIAETIAFLLLGVLMLWMSNFYTIYEKQPANKITAYIKLNTASSTKEITQSFATAYGVGEADIEIAKNKVVSKVKKPFIPANIVTNNSPAALMNNLIEAPTATTAAIPTFTFIEVANTEESLEKGNEKEIILDEETNNGKKVTTAYRIIEYNGQWYIVPLWMIKDEQLPIPDSIAVSPKANKKDSVIVLIPTVQ